jgi:hypothetical protein
MLRRMFGVLCAKAGFALDNVPHIIIRVIKSWRIIQDTYSLYRILILNAEGRIPLPGRMNK